MTNTRLFLLLLCHKHAHYCLPTYLESRSSCISAAIGNILSNELFYDTQF
jgi:hypothetical protein